MDSKLKKTCDDFLHYHKAILIPAAKEFKERLRSSRIKIHHVIQINMLVVHAIDYLQKIIEALESKKLSRGQFVKEFDNKFSIKGAFYINRKFQLADAVNNAVKHIELDPDRYNELIEDFGSIGFRCLREHDGLVLFDTNEYQFDFSRVVLRPILDIIETPSLGDAEDVIDFVRGELAVVFEVREDDDDPIDQMINYCNSQCLECGELEEGCRCSEFSYKGKQGEFRASGDGRFDFDAVLTRISGAYTRD